MASSYSFFWGTVIEDRGAVAFRNRTDHSNNDLGVVESKSILEPTIWVQIAREGGRVDIIGAPPIHPPRKVNILRVGSLLTPDTDADEYTSQPAVKERSRNLVGDYPVGVKGFHRIAKIGCDQHHILDEPDNPCSEIIRDYYCVLDEEVGTLFPFRVDL